MRSKALDTARGLAIVGVVFNHAVDGLVGADLLAVGSPIAELNAALYVFRMPALIFLVGLFVPGGIAKRGLRGYLTSRTTLLIYLYVVWQVVQGLVESATSNMRNGATTPLDILAIWFPLAHLWFLPFLAVATVIVATWVALSASPTLRFLGAVLILAVSLLAWAAPIDIAGLRGISLVGFLAAGAAVGLRRAVPILEAPRWRWAVVGALSVIGFVALHALRPYPATLVEPGPFDLVGNAISVVAASIGIVGLLAAAVLLSAVPGVGALFSHLGRHTLPIYLAHIVVVAGSRIVLSAVGVEDPLVLVLVLVPLGVAVPYALDRLAPRLRLTWLFGLPQPLARRVESTAGPIGRRRGASPTHRAASPQTAHRLTE